MNDAKDMWRETVRKLYENIKSVAEVGRALRLAEEPSSRG